MPGEVKICLSDFYNNRYFINNNYKLRNQYDNDDDTPAVIGTTVRSDIYAI